MDILLMVVWYVLTAIAFGIVVDALFNNLKRERYFVVGVEVFLLVCMAATVVKNFIFN